MYYRFSGVIDLVNKRTNRATIDIYSCHANLAYFALIKTKMKRFHVDFKVGYFIGFKNIAVTIGAASNDCRRAGWARGILYRLEGYKLFTLTI